MPNLLMIHEVVGPHNAIGKVAAADVRIALEAGYRVSVIAKVIDEELLPHVAWYPMYVPPRLFYLQWTTARRFIRRAMARAQAGQSFDIIHAHQPQVADLSDVFQCHFLTRSAYKHHSLEERKDLRSRIVRLQQQGVLHAEDSCFRRWNPRTHMLFVSELLQREFTQHYGKPPLCEVLPNACPPLAIQSEEQRRAARAALLGPNHTGIVAGYIGGLQERKGYPRILNALKNDPDIFLLMAGNDTRDFTHPAYPNRIKGIGLTEKTAQFYAACDVLLVPSTFDPCPLAPLEAAVTGTPVIATEGVGNAAAFTSAHAGELWDESQPLGPIIRHIATHRAEYAAGIQKLAEALSLQSYTRQLLAVYDKVLARNPQPLAASPVPA